MDSLDLARSRARKSIVHTMLKNSENSSASTSRSHRVYWAQFKTELVAACHQPGAAIAALRLTKGNEAVLTGCRGLAVKIKHEQCCTIVVPVR